jgi:uncharacterized protein (TIGR00251 family)
MRKFNVKVVAQSSLIKVIEQEDGTLKVWLTASPTDNQANKQLIKVLARHFNANQSSVVIVKGLTNKNKLVTIG